jgi:hypothetical protein
LDASGGQRAVTSDKWRDIGRRRVNFYEAGSGQELTG